MINFCFVCETKPENLGKIEGLHWVQGKNQTDRSPSFYTDLSAAPLFIRVEQTWTASPTVKNTHSDPSVSKKREMSSFWMTCDPGFANANCIYPRQPYCKNPILLQFIQFRKGKNANHKAKFECQHPKWHPRRYSHEMQDYLNFSSLQSLLQLLQGNDPTCINISHSCRW